MKKLVFIVFALFIFGCSQNTNAQEKNGQRVVLITLDGFRWQELFKGADPKLIANPEYVSDTTALREKYWKKTTEARRNVLMPFVWNEVAQIGEIHGNRDKGSKMNVTNGMWFSYPGYNEILTGKADDKNITSNDKIYNPNVTILETANNTDKYRGKVVAFTSWDVFPYIINDKRSGVPVNAGYKVIKGDSLTDTEKFLQRIEPNLYSPFGTSARLDFVTDNYALEYMKRKHPDLIYIANDETDDFAHQGKYTDYLNAAHEADAFLREIWEYTQKDPYYMGKTTFILTADHGRGTQPLKTWKSHGSDIKGADETWLIIFGGQGKKLGEVSKNEQIHTSDVRGIIEEILGLNQ